MESFFGSHDQCGFSIDRGIFPSYPKPPWLENSRKAHEERSKRVLRGYPSSNLIWRPELRDVSFVSAEHPLKQVAPEGAGIPVESLVLETGCRDAALVERSADPQSP